MSEFDSPWKEALDRWFAEFIELCFPQAHGEIDWSRGVEFLDAELQQISRSAEEGLRIVDRLAKVWLLDGTEEWVLIHLEVQSQSESGFARRLFVSHYRILDLYGHHPVTLAVLGDDRPGWCPGQWTYGRWGCELSFRFPVVKLLDWQYRWDELQSSANPFATVIMAHLKSMETRGRDEDRLATKIAFIRNLYAGGWSRLDIMQLFRVIDWFLELPELLERAFRSEVQTIDKENTMPYVTTYERLVREEGKAEGLEEAKATLLELLLAMLEHKFGTDANELSAKLSSADYGTLSRVSHQLKEGASLEVLRHECGL